MNNLDRFYLVYLLIHIPITILIDSNIVVPIEYAFEISKKILNFHIETNHDFLLRERPIWFQIFGLIELVFQLPLFFYCSYHIYLQKSKTYYIYMIIYGFNAAFTTFVCLGVTYFEGHLYGLTPSQVFNLIAIYVPYLLIPLLIMVDYSHRTIKLLNEKIKLE